MKKEKKALKAIKMVSATTSTIETKGRQDGQLAYVPALDKHGNPAFIAVETTMPDKPLQLGTSRKDTVKLEANLVKHIAALKWKEPKKKNMIVCAHCGKSVVREHATQKYCDACQKIVKKEKGKLRQRKSRQAKKNNVTEPYRGSAGEIILYVTHKNEIMQTLIPAFEAETLSSCRDFIHRVFPTDKRDILMVQVEGIFTQEKGEVHRRHIEIDTVSLKPVEYKKQESVKPEKTMLDMEGKTVVEVGSRKLKDEEEEIEEPRRVWEQQLKAIGSTDRPHSSEMIRPIIPIEPGKKVQLISEIPDRPYMTSYAEERELPKSEFIWFPDEVSVASSIKTMASFYKGYEGDAKVSLADQVRFMAHLGYSPKVIAQRIGIPTIMQRLKLSKEKIKDLTKKKVKLDKKQKFDLDTKIWFGYLDEKIARDTGIPMEQIHKAREKSEKIAAETKEIRKFSVKGQESKGTLKAKVMRKPKEADFSQEVMDVLQTECIRRPPKKKVRKNKDTIPEKPGMVQKISREMERGEDRIWAQKRQTLKAIRK